MKRISKIFITYFMLCLVVLSKSMPLYSQTGPFLIYNFSSGMFATFSSILGALDLYDGKNFAGLKVDLCDGLYLDPEAGPNWWEYFFEPINIGEEKEPKYTFTVQEHCYFVYHTFQLINRHRAFELIQKYIHVKPYILEEVQQFCDQYFKDYFIIGVHHRGTDKVIEQSLIPYEKTYQTIKRTMRRFCPNKKKVRIYVATDDQNFLKYIENQFPDMVVYNNFVRSSNGIPLHYGATNLYTSNYQKGKEALIDCLLLSKCNFLIRPQSSLSVVADRFNPNIPVIVLTNSN